MVFPSVFLVAAATRVAVSAVMGLAYRTPVKSSSNYGKHAPESGVSSCGLGASIDFIGVAPDCTGAEGAKW